MPIRWTVLRAATLAALASRGTAGVPGDQRALARFSSGCMLSPTRTYIVPDSTIATGSAPRLPCGRNCASTARTASTISGQHHAGRQAVSMTANQVVEHAVSGTPTRIPFCVSEAVTADL